MRTLLSALVVGLFVLVAAPQNAVACHKGTPHGMETSCDGAGTPTTKLVFLTSATYDGNDFGGLSGADDECQALADAAGLSGDFRAWISDSFSSPASDGTFVQSDVPYVRLDGVMVASSWADLVDGTILAQIEVDEEGNHPGVTAGAFDAPVRFVWTGTVFDGTSFDSSSGPANCVNWTNDDPDIQGNAGVGVNGKLLRTGPGWTFDDVTGCDRQGHLYCFEQE